MTTDLDKLPQFPVEHEEGRRRSEVPPPSLGEALSTLFEFSTGLALFNVLVLCLLMPYSAASAVALLRGEAPLLFGLFGLLLVVSRMAPLERAAQAAFEKGVEEGEGDFDNVERWAYLSGLVLALGAGVGVALGFGFAFALAQGFEHLVQGPLDNLIAGALFGALVGMVGGGGLTLAGGSPDWKVGHFFTALGRVIPALLGRLVPRRTGDVRLSRGPWLEGALWVGFVAGPLVWFFW
jgi:hypothetical protein